MVKTNAAQDSKSFLIKPIEGESKEGFKLRIKKSLMQKRKLS
jgi:hypothetical protein